MDKYIKEFEKFTNKREELIRASLDTGDIPNGVTGLIPDGNTKVAWRWMGEVFEDSADEILQNSIVVRNLQEAGVGSIEALKYLFPQKTEEERAAMLSGFPFRVVQQTQSSINSFISLLGSLYQLPHPQTPDLPLASDPNLDITGFLYRSLEYLRKELSYSGSYKPTDDGSAVPTLSDADRRRAALGRPIREQPRTDLPGIEPGSATSGGPGSPGLPAGGGPAGFGSGPLNPGGQSMAGGVPGAQRKSEYKQPLPSPGSILGLSDTNSATNYTSQLGFNSATAASASPVFGAADLQSASFNPGLLASNQQKPGGRSGKGRVSKSNKPN